MTYGSPRFAAVQVRVLPVVLQGQRGRREAAAGRDLGAAGRLGGRVDGAGGRSVGAGSGGSGDDVGRGGRDDAARGVDGAVGAVAGGGPPDSAGTDGGGSAEGHTVVQAFCEEARCPARR